MQRHTMQLVRLTPGHEVIVSLLHSQQQCSSMQSAELPETSGSGWQRNNA